MNPLDIILILCSIGLITIAINYWLSPVKDSYLDWEELIEKMKKEREEDESKRTKKNPK